MKNFFQSISTVGYFLKFHVPKVLKSSPKKAAIMITIIGLLVFWKYGISVASLFLVFKFFALSFVFSLSYSTAMIGYVIFVISKERKIPARQIIDRVYLRGVRFQDL